MTACMSLTIIIAQTILDKARCNSFIFAEKSSVLHTGTDHIIIITAYTSYVEGIMATLHRCFSNIRLIYITKYNFYSDIL